MVSFEELGISSKMAKAMSDMGWTEPTPIQVEAVPVGFQGVDITAQAQTGTGKTGAYASIVMGRVPTGCNKPAAIILVPTRELAVQVEQEIYKLSKYTHHKSIAIYGGASISDQMYKLKRGGDIIVGTPGRVKDMITRECLDLAYVKEVVLDEADRMLDMGFSEELDFIMDRIPKERQTLLFSATMADEIRQIAMRYMDLPVEISVSKDEPVSDLTAQYFIPVSRSGKRERLDAILCHGNPKVIVFCQTKKMVDDLMTEFSEKYKIGSIHGDMTQFKREKVIKNFRSGRTRVLVATDVAARGLDVKDIDIVVNYDVPPDSETYVHRIGRTGRAGKEGVAISFVTKQEDYRIRMYERDTGCKVKKVWLEDLPIVEHEDPVPVKPVLRMPEKISEPRPEKIEKKKLPVENGEPAVKARPKVRVKVARPDETRSDMTVMQVNLGKEDGFGRSQITEFVMKNARLTAGDVGRVGLGSSLSYIEVKTDLVDEVTEDIMKCRHNGKKMFIRVAPKKVSYAEKETQRIRQAGAFNSERSSAAGEL